MSEKGILMNGAMVRAIMREVNPKTQTRRIMRNQPRNGIRKCPWYPSGLEDMHGYQVKKLYWPGDHLYVRETYGWNGCLCCGLHYQATEPDWKKNSMSPLAHWYPSIHMPKSAARIWLDVLRVWPEIVENISEADARAEGFDSKAAFLEEMVSIYGDCLRKWCWATEFKRIEVKNG